MPIAFEMLLDAMLHAFEAVFCLALRGLHSIILSSTGYWQHQIPYD